MAKLEGVKTVDMVDGEITKISYDGAEYVKVAHDFKDARTGDIFFYNGRNGYYEITIRKRGFYGIDHPVRFTEDDGTDNGYMRSCPMHPLFRKISDTQTTPTLSEVSEKVNAIEQRVSALEVGALGVGDYVIVTREYNGFSLIGELGKIVKDDGSTVPYMLKSVDGKYLGWKEAKNIRKATDEEIAEATAPKFEVGEYVKVLASGEFGGVDVGECGKVAKGYADEGDRYSVRVDRIDGKKDHDYFRPQDLEKVGGKDVERIEQFAKAGRKLNEFKKGDVVGYDSVKRGRVCSYIISEVEDGFIHYFNETYGMDGVMASSNRLTLIAPVELRVDV